MDENRCYVGYNPSTNAYSIGCDGKVQSGVGALMAQGFTVIVFGPASWDACAIYLRERGVQGW